jgi:hypothetical protein
MALHLPRVRRRPSAGFPLPMYAPSSDPIRRPFRRNCLALPNSFSLPSNENSRPTASTPLISATGRRRRRRRCRPPPPSTVHHRHQPSPPLLAATSPTPAPPRSRVHPVSSGPSATPYTLHPLASSAKHDASQIL